VSQRYVIDTSVWIEHLRKGEEQLAPLLRERRALTHSAVIGELACGLLPKRSQFLADLQLLPRAQEAATDEVLHLIEERRLFGKGLGWVDAQLVASALLSDACLLTHDKRLAQLFRGLV
jgi:predicted nucleic acid-binding protein